MDIAEREDYIDTFDTELFRTATTAHQKRVFALYVLLREARKALNNEVVNDIDMREATEYLMPQRILLANKTKPRRDSLITLSELFSAKQTWTLEELYTQHGIKHEQIVYYIRRMFAIVAPADRLWIQFDPTTLSWTLLRKGPQMPRTYTGVLPDGKITSE